MSDRPKARPKPPDDLVAHGRGRRFWREITEEFDLSRAEMEILTETCRTLDELEALGTAYRKQGPTTRGSQGQLRANPLLGEIRSQRAELRRLVEQLGIPTPEDPAAGLDGVTSLASRRATKAARARWSERHKDQETFNA